MRRLGTVIVLICLAVVGKFGGLVGLSWEQLRTLGEIALIWLVFDLLRSPVTQFIRRPEPHPYFSKMMAVKAARISKQPLRLHLKSGETRMGYVVAHSLSHGSFVLSDTINDYSIQRHYQLDEIDELIVTSSQGRPIVVDEVAEGAT